MFARIAAAGLAAISIAAAAFADANEDLDTLIADIRAFDLAENPFLAAREGDTGALARLPDASLEAEQRRTDAANLFLARALSIPPSELAGAQQRVSHGLLIYMLQRRIMSADFDEARIPFTNDSGFFNTLTYASRYSPISSVEEADAQLTRLSSLPGYLDQHVANMRRGIETGFVQPALVVDRVIAILEAMQVGEDPRAHAVYEVFANLPAAMPQAERERIQAEAERIVVEEVAPAYAALLAFMRDEYRPAAREDSLGAGALPGGQDWYAALVRHYTTQPSATPESVHETGRAEVARIRAEMEAVIAETGFEGTFEEFLEFLRTDDQFYAETPEELLMRASWIAKRVDGLMPAYFGTLPRLAYGVMAVPDAVAPAYTTGRYWPGDPDRGVAGMYMVNTYDLRARPLYELPALTVHEAVPGHHHQIALAQEIEGVPEFRNELYVTAFGEGWGLYTERLAEEMGVYQTPYERFGRLSYEMWRACRLVVDTGLHHYGWSREEAEACFLENSALSRGNITTEVDRYIAWPGQALAYKTGELAIVALREEAETALGEDFDIRRFHDAVLLNGSMTLSMLQSQIRAWIEDELALALPADAEADEPNGESETEEP